MILVALYRACDVGGLVLWHAKGTPQVSSIHRASSLSSTVSSMTFQHWLQDADKGSVLVDNKDILISVPGVLSFFHPETLKFLIHPLKHQPLSPSPQPFAHGTSTPVQGQRERLKL